MVKEQRLLKQALLYEEGHKRRTEHILKVYAMTRMLAILQGIQGSDLEIVSAAAILHDIPIKRCKEIYNDACQENQQKEAPEMVSSMLKEAGYEDEIIDSVLDLVLHHHDYEKEGSILLQILIEADLMINSMEDPANVHVDRIEDYMKSGTAKELAKYF